MTKKKPTLKEYSPEIHKEITRAEESLWKAMKDVELIYDEDLAYAQDSELAQAMEYVNEAWGQIEEAFDALAHARDELEMEKLEE